MSNAQPDTVQQESDVTDVASDLVGRRARHAVWEIVEHGRTRMCGHAADDSIVTVRRHLAVTHIEAHKARGFVELSSSDSLGLARELHPAATRE